VRLYGPLVAEADGEGEGDGDTEGEGDGDELLLVADGFMTIVAMVAV
jgi:hypothetical protein